MIARTVTKVHQPKHPNAASTRYYLNRMVDWMLTIVSASAAIAFFVFLLAL